MKYIIDTNVFLRFFTNDQIKQARECKELLLSVSEDKIDAFTTSITLSEIVWTLQSFYSYSKDSIVEAVKSIKGIGGLEIINNYDNNFAIDLFEKNNVKFVDCLIASIPQIQKREWVLISYDKDFDKLKIIRKEPGDKL